VRFAHYSRNSHGRGPDVVRGESRKWRVNAASGSHYVTDFVRAKEGIASTKNWLSTGARVAVRFASRRNKPLRCAISRYGAK
jgi:hypothetical protein